jgi:D-alanyl-D-alanine dipeptidase
MRVKVAVGTVTAEARAMSDPRLLGPASVANGTGLVPAMAGAVARLEASGRGRFHVYSGFRTYSQQARLWADALERYGDPEIADDWVARPGTSNHEAGVAVDLAGDVALAARLVAQLGLPLHRPMSHEPWHFELLDTRS